MNLRKLKLEKKADVTDMVVVMLIMFFLAFSFIVVIFVNNQLYEIITTTALNESSVASGIASSFNTVNTIVVQRGYVLFMSILIIGVVGSAFLVRIHPAFIFLYIIVLSFTIFVSIFLGNAYDKFTDITELGAVAATQPMINFFMQNAVIVVLAVGALSMLVVFSKVFPAAGEANFT